MQISTDNYFSISKIWKIAFPIILGSLAQDIITVVDTAFIGRLGEVELGGAAIGGIFYLCIVMIGWGFGLGVQILIARRYGEENHEAINRLFGHSLFILLGLASFVFVVIKYFDHSIFNAIVESQAITDESLKFINIRIVGIFAAFININFRAFFIGIAHTKIIVYTTGVMAVVNIILDYLLIFGIGIFPQMDIEGAALASVIAEYIALVCFIVYALINKKASRFKLFRFEKLQWSLSKSILKIATPTLIQNFISFSSWFVFFLFVEKMGQTPLAISNIIRSIYIIILLPILGFASAANTLVSYSIGNNSIHNIYPIIKRTLAMAMVGVTLIVVLGLLFAHNIISIYTSVDSIVEAALPAFYVVLFASFAIGAGFILFQVVSGTGNTIVALAIEVIVISFYLTGVYAISTMNNPAIEWIWSLEIFYGLGLSVLSILYLKYGKWDQNQI